MTQRNPRRTDEEWLSLIQECRSSGLSDKCWCEEHHIYTSNFYYQIRRLRKKACTIPEPIHFTLLGKQEVVQLAFGETVPCPSVSPAVPEISSDAAVKIAYHGIQIEITNAAHRETISNILSVLQCLC